MHFKSGIFLVGLITLTHVVFAAAEGNSLRFIIKYKNPNKTFSLLKSEIGKNSQLFVKDMTPMANGAYSIILEGSTNSALVLNRLRQNSEVLYVVKDRVGHFKPVPDPTINKDLTQLLSHDSQWDEFSAPAGIMLESKPGSRDGAWAYTTGKGNNPTVIAVLDTGIALNESLVNNLVKDTEGKVFGWNFANNNDDLRDETRSYHGTHVAGTIAGYGNVIQGMGEDLKILTVKIPDASGMFYESSVINGIYWSVGGDIPGVPKNLHPAKVLNMSFGVDLTPGKEADYCDEAMQEAVSFARKKGAVLVAAAGNDNVWEHYNAPGACNSTLKIASTGPQGLRSYFSNYGPSITFAAPGGDKHYGVEGGILSTVNPGGGYNASGFDFYQGTSMATPHVAGLAGLIYAVSGKSIKPERVEQIMYTTTHDFGKTNDPNKSCVGEKPCGHGIIDAQNAVKTAFNAYDVLFSAPKAVDLVCGKNHDSIWIPLQSHCDSFVDNQLPRIEQSKDGRILAYYGSRSYQLDMKAFKECRVIGYDGVGCYL